MSSAPTMTNGTKGKVQTIFYFKLMTPLLIETLILALAPLLNKTSKRKTKCHVPQFQFFKFQNLKLSILQQKTT